MLLACAALAAACGGAGDAENGAADPAPVVLGQPGPGDVEGYLPLQVGNEWQFEASATDYGTPRSFRPTITSTRVTQLPDGVSATVFAQDDVDGRGSPRETTLAGGASGVAEYGRVDVAAGTVAVAPFWRLRFPLAPGSTFVQMDEARLDLGKDWDEDLANETARVRSVVTVLALEDVTVPAGTFARCAKLQTALDVTVTTSGTRQVYTQRALATTWYAPGIGWVRIEEAFTEDGALVVTRRFELAGFSVNGRSGGTIWHGPMPTAVYPQPTEVEVGVGGTAALTAHAWASWERLDGAPILWRSADPAIATVSADGVVTGVSTGTTAIYATSLGIESAAVAVRVLSGRTLQLASNDMLYDPVRARLYASVPSRQGADGNAVAVIDPATGRVEASLHAGSEPSRLALSDDARFLYVELDGVGRIIRFDLSAPGGPVKDLTIDLGTGGYYGQYLVADMEVVPGAPQTLAVARRTQNVGHVGVVVYDGAVRRTTGTDAVTGTARVLEFSDSPSRLYGISATGSQGIQRMTVDASGVTSAFAALYGLRGTPEDLEYAGGLLYMTNGVVVDPESLVVAGTLDVYPQHGLVEPDVGRGVVFFLSLEPSGIDWTLHTFDAATFVPLASEPVIVATESWPGDLIRWGERGLAYRTGDVIVFVDDPPGVH